MSRDLEFFRFVTERNVLIENLYKRYLFWSAHSAKRSLGQVRATIGYILYILILFSNLIHNLICNTSLITRALGLNARPSARYVRVSSIQDNTMKLNYMQYTFDRAHIRLSARDDMLCFIQ